MFPSACNLESYSAASLLIQQQQTHSLTCYHVSDLPDRLPPCLTLPDPP